MLALSRLKDERIFIGDKISILVIDIFEREDGKLSVRLGIDAPRDVQIVRDNTKNCDPTPHRRY
jgi:carbon storage regulator CsrA